MYSDERGSRSWGVGEVCVCVGGLSHPLTELSHTGAVEGGASRRLDQSTEGSCPPPKQVSPHPSSRSSYLKCVMWFSSSTIRRLLMAWNFSFSSTVTVPVPSGLNTRTQGHAHHMTSYRDTATPSSGVLLGGSWIGPGQEQEAVLKLLIGSVATVRIKTA